MKKTLSRVLAIALVAALVLSLGTLAFADDEKTLYLGLGFESTSLNPLTSNVGAGTAICNAIYGCMWTMTCDGEVNYELAESYEYNEDQTQLTVKLRDDANWNDGTPVTAEDVLFTLEYYKSGPMAFHVMDIDFEASHAEDDKTVVIVINRPNPMFVESMALAQILSKATFDEGGEEALGHDPRFSGAYMVEKFTTGEDVVLVKNPGYYNTDNLIYDKIVITCNSDEQTQFLNFQTDEYDIAAFTDDKFITQIKNGDVDGYHDQLGAIQCITFISMNTFDFDTFKDVNVRGAIAHAVDWETLMTEICGPNVVIATSPLLPSGNWAYKNEGIYEYDPDLAVEMLEEAGYGPGEFSFTAVVADEEFNSQLMEAMQAYLADVGIVMNVVVKDGATVREESRAQQIEMVISKSMGANDPAGVTNGRMSNSPHHATMFGATELGETYLEDLLDEADTSTADQETRKAMFEEIQDLAWEYYFTFPLYESAVHFGVSDSIGDFACAIDASNGYLHLDQFTVDQVTVD